MRFDFKISCNLFLKLTSLGARAHKSCHVHVHTNQTATDARVREWNRRQRGAHVNAREEQTTAGVRLRKKVNDDGDSGAREEQTTAGALLREKADGSRYEDGGGGCLKYECK
jgi:hypothetical protein